MFRISSKDIETWTESNKRQSQEILPLIVQKMIRETTDSKAIIRCDIPYGDNIAISGWDGIVEVTEGNEFLPSGKTILEIGTNENPLSKANGDIKKRYHELGEDTRNYNFVFVTSRLWSHRDNPKDTWIREKEIEQGWNKVVILDSQSLENWFSNSILSSIWFKEEILGIPERDILSVKEYIGLLKSNSSYDFDISFYDYDNSDFGEKLDTIFKEQNVIYVKGSDRKEVLGILAYILRETPKTLFVMNKESWDFISRIRLEGYILIPCYHSDSVLKREDSKIIVPITNENYAQNFITYKNRSKKNLLKKLELMMDYSTAYKIANECHLVHSSICRHLFNDDYNKPQWFNTENTGLLIPALLIGSWDEKIDGDRFVLEYLSGMDYEVYISKLNPFLLGIEPFWIRVKRLSKCVVNNIDVPWYFLGKAVVNDDRVMKSFEDIVKYVFFEIDPKWDLSIDKHFMSEILGKKSKLSKRIKEGIIVSMYYISKYSEIQFIDKILESIFSDLDDIKKWFNISEFIDDFIEISPSIVLGSIYNDLNKNKFLMQIFDKTGKTDFLFGRHYYTHFIWALEKSLSWKEHSWMALEILLKLSEFDDIEYTMSNTPFNTLINALQAWIGNVHISVEEKVNFVNYVYNTSKIKYKVLKEILPDGGFKTSFGLSKPKLRLESFESNLSSRDVNLTYDGYIEVVINSDEITIEDILLLINVDILFRFNKLTKFNEVFMLFITKETSDFNRFKLYSHLRDLIYRHRFFVEAEWSIPEEMVMKIEKLLNYVSFDNDLYSHMYLFTESSPNLLNPVPFRTDDSYMVNNDNSIYELRTEAMEFILIDLKILDDFLSKCPLNIYNEHLVGNIVFSIISEKNIEYIICVIKKLINYDRYLICRGLLKDLKEVHSLNWIIDILEKVNVEKNKLFRVYNEIDLDEEFFNYLITLDDYTQKTVFLGYSHISIKDMKLQKDVFGKLMDYGNNRVALDILSRNYKEYSVEDIIRCLESIAIDFGERKNQNSMIAYHIERLMDYLHKSDLTDTVLITRIVSLEISFLKITRRKAKFFEDTLSNNCKFFYELVTLAYKSTSDIDNNVVKSESELVVARNAYSILEELKRKGFVPFLLKESPEEDVEKWFKDIVVLIRNGDHKKISMQVIGEILSKVPKKGGVYPSEFVAKIIEDTNDQDFNIGFGLGITNSRGVVTGSYGKREQELCDIYRRYAEYYKDKPNTFSILTYISKRFNDQAQYEKTSDDYGDF